jgi:hypothetical protein
MAGCMARFFLREKQGNNRNYKDREVDGVASHLIRAKNARRRWGTRRGASSPHSPKEGGCGPPMVAV